MLSITAFVVSASAIGQSFDDVVEQYRQIHANKAAYVAAGVLQALAVALLAPVLRFLYKVTAYRREQTPGALLSLGTLAPLGLGILAVAGTVTQLGVVDRVVDALPLPLEVAEDVAQDERAGGASVAIGIGGSIAALTIAAVLILLNQNARRAGVLSNFLGIIGIIVGVFLVIGPLIGQVLGPVPIVQWFWLGALALLFLGRWPGGRPPAWRTGEEEPWPSAAELRQQAGDGSSDGRSRAPEPEPADEDEPDEELEEDEAAPAAPGHPRSKKRKRKRKR